MLHPLSALNNEFIIAFASKAVETPVWLPRILQFADLHRPLIPGSNFISKTVSQFPNTLCPLLVLSVSLVLPAFFFLPHMRHAFLALNHFFHFFLTPVAQGGTWPTMPRQPKKKKSADLPRPHGRLKQDVDVGDTSPASNPASAPADADPSGHGNFEHLMVFDYADDLPIKPKDKNKKSLCIELGMATHFNYRNLKKIQGLPPMTWWGLELGVRGPSFVNRPGRRLREGAGRLLQLSPPRPATSVWPHAVPQFQDCRRPRLLQYEGRHDLLGYAG